MSAEVTEAVKDATTKSAAYAQEKLAEIYQGLDIPGVGWGGGGGGREWAGCTGVGGGRGVPS